MVGIDSRTANPRETNEGMSGRHGRLTIAAAVENVKTEKEGDKKDDKKEGKSESPTRSDSQKVSQGNHGTPSSFTEGAEAIKGIELSEKAESEKRLEKLNELLLQLERMKKERDDLEEESKKLREALHASKDAAPQPTVVFQHRELDEHWQSKLAQLSAAKTTEKMLEALHHQVVAGDNVLQSLSLSNGAINERGVDLSKEASFSDDATLEQVQERVKQVLVELHLRTRLEAKRLREAVKFTEDSVQHEQMQKLSHQLVVQENELQRLMEEKVQEIRSSAEEEIAKIDQSYDERIREEWVQVNTQAEQLHDHAIKIKEIQLALESERELEKERENIKKHFDQTAKSCVERIKVLRESIYKMNEDVEGFSNNKKNAQACPRCACAQLIVLVVVGAPDLPCCRCAKGCGRVWQRLRSGAEGPKKAGRQGGDAAVDAVLSTIPSKDVASLDDLQTR
eukprot:748176-Hanusia_phi.AAC.3